MAFRNPLNRPDWDGFEEFREAITERRFDAGPRLDNNRLAVSMTRDSWRGCEGESQIINGMVDKLDHEIEAKMPVCKGCEHADFKLDRQLRASDLSKVLHLTAYCKTARSGWSGEISCPKRQIVELAESGPPLTPAAMHFDPEEFRRAQEREGKARRPPDRPATSMDAW